MSSPVTPPDWDSIARYLSGESNAEERSIVRAWLDANPADRELVERLNGSVMIDEPADVDVEAALARVHERMGMPHRPTLTLGRGGAGKAAPSKRTAFIGGIVGIAAAAAVAFVVTKKQATPATPATPSAVAHGYTTGVGKRDSILLADGSRVILGPESHLDVPSTYGATNRSVTLTGDAFFDVRHDASKPFQVRANGALVEDIGTTFAVESDGIERTRVSVVSGSVRLRAESGSSEGVVLAAGDRGTVDQSGEAHLEKQAVREEDTAWVSGRLAFRDAPLSRVAAEIERWYGVKVRITDSALAAQHVTTSFDGDSADQALRILGLTMNARIERKGDSAIVSPLRGSSPR